MRWFVLLLIVVPALEITLLIAVGRWIGFWPTVLLMLSTGFIGAWLAKKEGGEVLRLARVQLGNGDVPSAAILDGLCVLVGAVLLLTPGLITDSIGFLLLLPNTRGPAKAVLARWFKKKLATGHFTFYRW